MDAQDFSLQAANVIRHAAFLNGPIGAGKTALGRAAAGVMRGKFFDGDDFADQSRPWYCSIRTTSAAIVEAALTELRATPVVVVAYPLTCKTWIYFRRHMAAAGIEPMFVSLRASFDSIVAPSRGRIFSDDERQRIRIMIEEGYAERPFSDLIIDTDRDGFDATVAHLVASLASKWS